MDFRSHSEWTKCDPHHGDQLSDGGTTHQGFTSVTSGGLLQSGTGVEVKYGPRLRAERRAADDARQYPANSCSPRECAARLNQPGWGRAPSPVQAERSSRAPFAATNSASCVSLVPIRPSKPEPHSSRQAGYGKSASCPSIPPSHFGETRRAGG